LAGRPDGWAWEAILAGWPDWLGGQIGWEARLAGRPDWLGGKTGLYLILHLVNNSTLSNNRLS
jgi:hypothetical protein